MNLRHRLATAALVASVLLSSAMSDAFGEPISGPFLYEYLGTPLSGSFPGGTFTGATIRLRATGDGANVISGASGNFITVTPTVEVLISGSAAFTGTLLATDPQQWRVISTSDYGSASGFIRFDTTLNTFDRSLVALGGPLLTLTSDATTTGPLQGGGGSLGTLTTNGEIFIDPAFSSTATFSVTAVPEPSTVAMALAGVAASEAGQRTSSHQPT